ACELGSAERGGMEDIFAGAGVRECGVFGRREPAGKRIYVFVLWGDAADRSARRAVCTGAERGRDGAAAGGMGGGTAGFGFGEEISRGAAGFSGAAAERV